MRFYFCFVHYYQVAVPFGDSSPINDGSALDDEVDALSSRLGGMAILLEGSSRDEEADELLSAISQITLDPTEQSRPPTIGLRGAGAAFQVGAAVAKKTNNVFKVGIGTERRVRAPGDAGKPSSEKRKNNVFRIRRPSGGNERQGDDVCDKIEGGSDAAGHKRRNRNRSPVWRSGSLNDKFMEENGFGYGCGSGGGGSCDGGGGGPLAKIDGNDADKAAGVNGSPAVVLDDDDDDDDMPCALWEKCMGDSLEEEADAGSSAGYHQDMATKSATAAPCTAAFIQANITSKRDKIADDQRKLLVLLHHVCVCRADEDGRGCEVTEHCGSLKRMWRHVIGCKHPGCSVSHQTTPLILCTII